MNVSRRDVLKGAVTVAAALATPWDAALAEAPPAARWFKIGACEWMLGRGNPTSFEVAKEIGLDGVQLDLGNAKNDMHLLKPEVQKAYLGALE